MAIDKGLAAVLRALGDVSYPDDYSDKDEALDFASTFLRGDGGAGLRTLGRILDVGRYFRPVDVSAIPHSIEPLQHIEGMRVLCGHIVNRLSESFFPSQPGIGNDDPE